VNFGSVCSGIEAASVAWNPIGWRAQFVSEIDRFPCAVLEQRHGSVPNLGDMTNFKEWPDAAIDVLVGGTPCQSFSVAGLRGGLADPRGNLMLTYLAIVARYQPEWLVWENVPGVLSSNKGRDFGALLGGMAELGYGFAYRVLDAQYFNLAQRRERVFVVGCLGSWQRAAAVLFERASLRGDLAPSRQSRENIAAPITAGSPGGSGYRNDADTTDNLIAHALRADGFDASEDGTGRGTPLTIATPLTSNPYGDHESREGLLVPVANTLCGHGGRMRIDETYVPLAFNARQDPISGPITGPIDTDGTTQAVAFAQNSRDEVIEKPIMDSLKSGGGKPGQSYAAIRHDMAVRRLTPRECERLQGFDDDYTLIEYRGKPAADGPRYKALGNSMAVPVMRWIGRRIQLVHWLLRANAVEQQAESAEVA
jgi:DNA (cytosine-5)-methyltransferase 1